MKKRITMLLVSALFLVGCGESQDNEPKKDEEASQNSQIEQNENGGNEGCNEGNQDNEENNPSGGNEGGNQQELNEHKATIITSGDAFAEVLGPKVQLSNEENYKGNVDKLKNYINGCINYDGCLTGFIFGGYVQTIDAANGQFICLGSQSTGGEMTWNSTNKILKVEVTVSNYYKTFSYGTTTGCTCDNEAHLILDETDNSLEIEKNVVPTESTFSASYGTEGVNSFKIASTGGRVLISKFAITWKI